MADVDNACPVSPFENVEEILRLLWGKNVKDDIFKRWSQGFVFSTDEPSALIQEQGGPCAVIASVQAYLLKSILFVEGTSAPDDWRQLTDDQARHFLVCSICEMLQNVKTENFTLVLLKDHLVFTPRMTLVMDRSKTEEAGENASSSSPDSQSPDYHKSICGQELETLSSEMFHSKLCQVHCHVSEDLTQVINKNIAMLEGRFGVLLFLYSILLTKGIESIKSEMEDVGEPLIDTNFGLGSQTLINLMLTGHSVSNVWDSNRDLSGLELKGIPSQSSIGFLTLLEAHRYCEVGNFLKSPKFPIWLLGSETHLTVFFSEEQSLTGSESDREKGLRVFKSHDQQDNGFITIDKLENVLEDLGLVSDPDYVCFMKERLDQDSMGIILQQNFITEFFPGEDNLESDVRPFKAFHYNGLGVREAEGTKKFVYTEGLASIEPTDFSHIAEQQIVTCLKTKWPGMWLEWNGKNVPSLN
ncbi:Ubiquitin carboxyl-terminal hydrolase MINDY-3 [Acropora cervicornis]|uniref:Ubiquitin carboxyl-terminal hydrolase MINDY n=1 Tax=Acropora cervicornis TaxID=6130 RepID=A0AAD9VDC5_ACRCE|nr:Ubiquitin carboxyl-terminal hydrolase MINDY-3 [Acropora cervicornis]